MVDWEWVINLPHYRYGVALFGLVAVLPALVSGNMIHEVSQLLSGSAEANWKAVLMNLGILAASVALIGLAVWQWL